MYFFFHLTVLNWCFFRILHFFCSQFFYQLKNKITDTHFFLKTKIVEKKKSCWTGQSVGYLLRVLVEEERGGASLLFTGIFWEHSHSVSE